MENVFRPVENLVNYPEEQDMNRIAILIILVSILSGCITADFIRLDSEIRAETNPEQIEVLVEDPERPYKVIAMIEVSDEGWDFYLEELKDRMVIETAALGGDAVIIGIESRDSGTIFTPMGAGGFIGTNLKEKRILGKVIVYTKN